MIIGILKDLWRLRNRDYIPPAPSGYSVPYSQIDPESRRVMARLGIRSPAGLERALRRADVQTVDELVAALKHYRPKRRVRHRWQLMLDRLFGGSRTQPHEAEIRAWARRPPATVEIDRRVQNVVQLMRKK